MPRYDFDDITPKEFADVAAKLINGALAIAQSEMISQQIKIHAASNTDRQFFSSVVEQTATAGLKGSFKLRGNWLEISNVGKLKGSLA